MRRQIKVARFVGFCSGVTIAVRKTEKLLKEKKIYCIGELIHNTFVIQRLKKLGLIVVKNCRLIPAGSSVIIRAHGLPLETIEHLRKKNCEIFDFTCPILKKIHASIEKFKKEKFSIIIIGTPDHAEVKALLSRAGKSAAVIRSVSSAALVKKSRKAAVIGQSTIDGETFERLSGEILKKNKDALVFDTICNEVKARRKEAIGLAKKSKMVIIVGDRKSSNTKNLAKIVKNICPVIIVTGENELLRKKIIYPVGVTSGASSPRELVLEIVKKIKKARLRKQSRA